MKSSRDILDDLFPSPYGEVGFDRLSLMILSCPFSSFRPLTGKLVLIPVAQNPYFPPLTAAFAVRMMKSGTSLS